MAYEEKYSLSTSRRKSSSVEPNSTNARANRYKERVKAREKLRILDIVDVARSPQSVMSHGLLTQDCNKVIDILA